MSIRQPDPGLDPDDRMLNDFWRIWRKLPEDERLKLIKFAETLAEEREQAGESDEADIAEEEGDN
jgi:hypothetical protein